MCIVEHPGFQAVCLNHWMLQAAWQYKQQYGASAYEELDHKKQFSHSPLEDWARATLLPLKWLLPSKQNAPSNTNLKHGNDNNNC